MISRYAAPKTPGSVLRRIGFAKFIERTAAAIEFWVYLSISGNAGTLERAIKTAFTAIARHRSAIIGKAGVHPTLSGRDAAGKTSTFVAVFAGFTRDIKQTPAAGDVTGCGTTIPFTSLRAGA